MLNTFLVCDPTHKEEKEEMEEVEKEKEEVEIVSQTSRFPLLLNFTVRNGSSHRITQ